MSRTHEICIALTQLLNAASGGFASESFSSRCWRMREYHPFSTLRRAIDIVFFWDREHCRSSYQAHLARRGNPNLPPAA